MSVPASTCVVYERRQPELTPCFRVVNDHLAEYVAARVNEGRPLPAYVVKEFEAYLRCGILAYGFLRVQCEACNEERVVAFSCKRRGFCPSCCAKRMAETATHLVDNLLPFVPYRQFVITFPHPLRYWLQSNRGLFNQVHHLVIAAIEGYYKTKATVLGIKDPEHGSISFTQRWGSALNLNPHLHILSLDGVYNQRGEKLVFRKVEAISEQEVGALLSAIVGKIIAYLQKKGYLDEQGELVTFPGTDPLFAENEAIRTASACSITGRIAFGANAGKYVTRIGSGFGFAEEVPRAQGKRCCSMNGFSLHANTATNTFQRAKLSQLIEYIARGPLSNQRLEITSEGKVKLQLKKKWSDGTTHLLFTPGEFLEKITALIPPPRAHLVRWKGVFAPHSKLRKAIILRPEIKKGFHFNDEVDDPKKPAKNSSWAKMLAKVFGIDVLTCEKCRGRMRAICAVKDPSSISRYLQHVGLPAVPPARSPPQLQELSFDREPKLSYEPLAE